jgi:alginate production protein
VVLLAQVLAVRAPAQETRPKTSGIRVEDLLPGHRVKAKVVRTGEGPIRSDDLELLPRGGRDSVLGPVESLSGDRFSVFGVRVEIVPETEGEGGGRFRRDSLHGGDWAKVDGRFREGGLLRARRVRAEEPRERGVLEGRVDAVEPAADGWDLRILGTEVRVPARTRVDVPEELGETPLESLTEGPPSRGRRTEEDFVPGTIRLGDFVTLGGTVTARVGREEEFDLDAGNDRDRTRPSLRIRLEATARPSERVFLVAGVEDERAWTLRDDGGEGRSRTTNLRETFVFFRDVLGRGIDLEAGRLHFKDDRQWLYDRDLDGVRVTLDGKPWLAEASLTTVAFGGRATRPLVSLGPVNPLNPVLRHDETSGERDEETTNAMAVLTREFSGRNAVSAFFIGRFDRGKEDDSPLFAGVQARLRPVEDVRAWADLALARGRDRDERIRGSGFDVGATWVLPLPLEPSLTAGYAFGSGGDDDPANGDSDFRQTGLQDNTGRWNGVTTFGLYGELLDPELSNLGIATAGLGFRPGRRTSLDLVAHRYAQPRPARFLRDSGIRGDLDVDPVNSSLAADPDGVHHEIGWEYDAILGWRELPSCDVEIVVGRFEPGAALSAAGRSATFLKLEVRLKF